MSNILTNLVYSIFLFTAALLSAIGLGTYQWIEAEAEDLQSFGDTNHIPGLNKVSCGLISYCIDAAGRVSECSLPWPIYNDDITDQPSQLWTAAAGCIATAIALLILAWLYSLVACFGCYTRKRQLCCVNIVNLAAVLLLVSLVIWGASFPEYAVEECLQKNADGECSKYKTQFPSYILESGKENIGCRICHSSMTYYSMASTCSFGWGGMITVAAFIITCFTACCGRAVQPRSASKKVFVG